MSGTINPMIASKKQISTTIQFYLVVFVLFAEYALVIYCASWFVLLYTFVMAHLYMDKRLISWHEILDLGDAIPLPIKNYLQDIMSMKYDFIFLTKYGGIFWPAIIVRKVQAVLGRCKNRTIVALSSGRGKAESFISRVVSAKIILTDYNPNVAGYQEVQKAIGQESVEYVSESVDLFDIPEELRRKGGLFCAIASMHHFRRDDLKRFFQGVVEGGQSIFLLDGRATFSNVIIMPFRGFSFGLVYGIWFGIRRLDVMLLFLTITMLLPLMVAYEALISALRFYSRSEIEEIISEVKGAEDYHWDLSSFDTLKDWSVLFAYPKIS